MQPTRMPALGPCRDRPRPCVACHPKPRGSEVAACVGRENHSQGSPCDITPGRSLECSSIPLDVARSSSPHPTASWHNLASHKSRTATLHVLIISSAPALDPVPDRSPMAPLGKLRALYYSDRHRASLPSHTHSHYHYHDHSGQSSRQGKACAPLPPALADHGRRLARRCAQRPSQRDQAS